MNETKEKINEWINAHSKLVRILCLVALLVLGFVLGASCSSFIGGMSAIG